VRRACYYLDQAHFTAGLEPAELEQAAQAGSLRVLAQVEAEFMALLQSVLETRAAALARRSKGVADDHDQP